MIVWVLWEDQRGEGTKYFGPHALLISCLQDDFGDRFARRFLDERVRANPKKSSSKVLADLKANSRQFLDSGALCAVFDRDQAHRLWSDPPARCLTSLLERVRSDVPGPCEVVFLDKNVETLTAACRKAVGKEPSNVKPSPAERDAILGNLAFSASPELRARVRADVPSFDRLVRKIREKIADL